LIPIFYSRNAFKVFITLTFVSKKRGEFMTDNEESSEDFDSDVDDLNLDD